MGNTVIFPGLEELGKTAAGQLHNTFKSSSKSINSFSHSFVFPWVSLLQNSSSNWHLSCDNYQFFAALNLWRFYCSCCSTHLNTLVKCSSQALKILLPLFQNTNRQEYACWGPALHHPHLSSFFGQRRIYMISMGSMVIGSNMLQSHLLSTTTMKRLLLGICWITKDLPITEQTARDKEKDEEGRREMERGRVECRIGE